MSTELTVTPAVLGAPAEIAIVGGGYAGVLAAQRLARRAGDRARVTLVTASPSFVERIRLHEAAAGRPPRTRAIADLLRGTGARLELARVIAVDVAGRRLRLDDGGVRRWRPVDYLVLAAGSATATPLPGVAEHAHRLDSPDSAAALGRAARAAAAAGTPLVVIGAGLTGIEVTTELCDAVPGLRAILVCRGGVGDGALGPAAVAHVKAALARRAIELREHTTVTAIEPGVVVTAAGRIAAGAVVWAAGFAASPLAADAGLAVDGLGRMRVDETLAVPSAPWLFGAGDAAAPPPSVGAPIVMSCKTAMPMGAHAADNLAAIVAGRAPQPFRFGDTGVCVSLGRRDGVVQLRTRAGGNRGVLRRRSAAWVKERICRYTVGSLRLTRRWAGFYRWLAAPRVLRAPTAEPAALPAGATEER